MAQKPSCRTPPTDAMCLSRADGGYLSRGGGVENGECWHYHSLSSSLPSIIHTVKGNVAAHFGDLRNVSIVVETCRTQYVKNVAPKAVLLNTAAPKNRLSLWRRGVSLLYVAKYYIYSFIDLLKIRSTREPQEVLSSAMNFPTRHLDLFL